MKVRGRLSPLLIASLTVLPVAAGPVLVDFDQPDETAVWKTVNDNVMGGRSKGGFEMDHERGVMVFSGNTNTDGGGFSSIRTLEKDWEIGDASGIEIRFRGDGRTFMADLRKKGGRGWVPLAWRANFKTEKAGVEWQTIRIPFADFGATRMGRSVNGGAIKGADIGSIGFMIYDKKDGPFKLEVDSISAYREPVPEGTHKKAPKQ